MRHHGFSRSSLYKVTSEQALRNLLIEFKELTKMTEPRGIVLKKTHWIWHLWLLAASLLLLSMVVFNPIFVERWISPDGHMETDGLNLLAKLRFGAFILAVMCCLFWTFRRRFSQIFLTRYDPQHWQIPDWLGFAITFGLLMLYPC